MAPRKKPAAAKKTTAKKAPAKKAPAKKTAAKKPAPAKTAAKAAKAPAKAEAFIAEEAALEGAGKQAEFKTTVAHMLGEIIWLLNQSPVHRHFSISDLDWIVAPAIGLGQYRVFRAGQKPIGVAFWAWVNDDTDQKLKNGEGRIRPDEWKGGDKLWLIELISPFATAENKMTEAMFADLVNGPFKGQTFRFTKTNPQTGKREVAEFTPNQNQA